MHALHVTHATRAQHPKSTRTRTLRLAAWCSVPLAMAASMALRGSAPAKVVRVPATDREVEEIFREAERTGALVRCVAADTPSGCGYWGCCAGGSPRRRLCS